MARKLSEEERNNINYLTSALVAALPAHLRGHAGTIASSLVRIPRETIAARDINRIVGRIGEHKDELKAAIREHALTPVKVPEGEPEAFVLKVPAPEEIEKEAPGAEPASPAEHSADDREPAANAEAEPLPAVEDAVREQEPAQDPAPESKPESAPGAEPAPAPTKRPARRTRRRRVGDKGGAKVPEPSEEEPSSEQTVEADGVERAEEGGEPATVSAPAAATPDVEEAGIAGSDAVGAPASDAASAAAEPIQPAEAQPAEKRRRTRRRSRGKSAAAAQVADQAAEAPASAASAGNAEAPGQAASEQPASEPASGPQAEPSGSPTVTSDAPDAPEQAVSDTKPLVAQEAGVPAAASAAPAPTPAAADSNVAPEAQVQQPQSQQSGNAGRSSRGRGRGRRGSGGNGGSGSGNSKRSADSGRTLAEVPYIRRGGEEEAQIRQRIVSLDSRFWMNGWLLSHPGAFTLYEKELVALNDALANGMLPGDVTRRQLAYQMGGDEKFFEYGSDGFKLLRAMGVEDLIRHRPMPKADLLYHAPRRRKHMRVLVTENLDPWLDVRDLMYEDGRSTILGERIHAVVLGGGMPVLETNRLHLLLDVLGADSYDVLYWGDIDRAGFDIFNRLRTLLEGKFDVKPFTPAYQLMCDRAMERFPDPLANEKTGQVNIEVGDTATICDGLTPEAAAYANVVIDNCGLVPQEILTKRDL